MVIKNRRDIDYDVQGDEDVSQIDALWDTAQNNEWYKWAAFTAKETGKENCLLCSKSPLNKVVAIPNPYDYRKCAQFGRNFCHLTDFTRPYCIAECLGFLGNPKLTDYFFRPLWGSWCQYSDIGQNIKIEKQKVEIPKWYSIDYKQEYECFHKPKGTQDVGKFKGRCAIIWYIDKKNSWKSGVPSRAPELLAFGTTKGSKIAPEKCENQTIALPPIEIYEDQSLIIADFFWICGGEILLPSLPVGWKGICVRVRLLQEVSMAQWGTEQSTNKEDNRTKRGYEPDPNVYLDSIGQPRGIPNKFKARSEIKGGFESILVWITPNKNTEWINYIYYNQQRFINYTDEALTLLGDQVHATSRMTWQNRQALNWLLADKGGVCVMFGDQCCTFIPNNTAPGGAFSEVMTKIKKLRNEITTNAGRDQHIWDWIDVRFGAWGAWFVKLGMFLGVAILIGGLLFCCVLPLLRSLIINATVKQMGVIKVPNNQQRIIEKSLEEYYEGWLNKLNLNEQTLDDSSIDSEDVEDV